MISQAPVRRIGVLLSGGLDSAILVAHLLTTGHRVQPFYVRTGTVWQAEEACAVDRFLAAIDRPLLDPLVTFDMPVSDLYGEHWSTTGRDTPAADSADAEVYLPGRNALLALKPVIWCQMHGIERLGLATLGTSPFADATDGFLTALSQALTRGGSAPIRIVRPFGRLTKRQVMELGRDLPLHLTFSCIAPRDGLHCGVCNKCEERQQAFRSVGWSDATPYYGLGEASAPALAAPSR